MKNVLFLLQTANIFTLYAQFAIYLKKNGYNPVFLDVSKAINYKNNDDVQTLILKHDLDQVTYDLNDYPEKYKLYYFADEILAKVDPLLIVVPFESFIYSLFVHQARYRSVRSLHIQHALWGPGKFKKNYNLHPSLRSKNLITNELSKFIEVVKIILKNLLRFFFIPKHFRKSIFAIDLLGAFKSPYPIQADFFAVPSEYYRKMVISEMLKNKGSQKVIVSGYLRNISSLDGKETIYSLYGVDTGKKVFTYFYTPFYRYKERFVENVPSELALLEFIQACQKVEENSFFLIFIHPTKYDEKSYTESYLLENGIKNFKIELAGDNLPQIYLQSKLIAGAKTTALVEARSINSRVLRQEYVIKGSYNENELEDDGIVVVKDSSELFSSVSKLLHDELKDITFESLLVGKGIKQSAQQLFIELSDRNCI